MLRLAFDFIITWRETRTRPNAYDFYCIYKTYFYANMKIKNSNHKFNISTIPCNFPI